MGRFRIPRRIVLAVAVLAVLAVLFNTVTVFVGLWFVSGCLRDVGPKLFDQSVAAILRDGDADQKAQMLELLGTMGAEARQFVPSVVAALEDCDPRVRKAAEDALKKIDPHALEEAVCP